jgi:hypothetical protein
MTEEVRAPAAASGVTALAPPSGVKPQEGLEQSRSSTGAGLELTIRWALETWCDQREDPNDMPARMVRSWHFDLARSVAQAIDAQAPSADRQ